MRNLKLVGACPDSGTAFFGLDRSQVPVRFTKTHGHPPPIEILVDPEDYDAVMAFLAGRESAR